MGMGAEARFKNALPEFAARDPAISAALGAQARQLDKAGEAMRGAFRQMFLKTADASGLPLWEEFAGVRPDMSFGADARRSVVRAKLVGAGTSTKARMEALAESFQYGEIEVDEHAAEYRITVRFVSRFGVPANLAAMKDAMAQFVPAHLALVYEFRYRTWDEAGAYTWDQLAACTWDDVLEGEIG